MSERLKKAVNDVAGSLLLLSVCFLVPLVFLGQVAAAATGQIAPVA